MPLKSTKRAKTKKGKQKIVSENISELVRAGKPRKQAVAIALESRRRDVKHGRRR